MTVPVFDDMYWGYGQRSLRAAHQIRRRQGVYSIWCSNYSCGPDSFNLHFYAYIMEGQPFAVIETDGHSGDAGHQDARRGLPALRPGGPAQRQTARHSSQRLPGHPADAGRLRPTFGLEARSCSSRAWDQGPRCWPPRCTAVGIPAESLPMPDRESVRIGRRYTSGKECVPMCITLGSLLQRLERERDSNARFAFFMPRRTGRAASASTTCCTRSCSSGCSGRTASVSGRRWTTTTSRACPADSSGCVSPAGRDRRSASGPARRAAGRGRSPAPPRRCTRQYAAELVERMRAEASRQPTVA